MGYVAAESARWWMTGIGMWKLSYDGYFIKKIKSNIISQVGGRRRGRFEKKGEWGVRGPKKAVGKPATQTADLKLVIVHLRSDQLVDGV